MREIIQQALRTARTELHTLYGERLAHVVLYGSQARGEAGPESDVDVLVVLRDPFDLYTESKRLALLHMVLLDRFEVMISFQPYTLEAYLKQDSPFMFHVREDGVPV